MSEFKLTDEEMNEYKLTEEEIEEINNYEPEERNRDLSLINFEKTCGLLLDQLDTISNEYHDYKKIIKYKDYLYELIKSANELNINILWDMFYEFFKTMDVDIKDMIEWHEIWNNIFMY